MTTLKIRKDRTAAVLRKLAKGESNGPLRGGCWRLQMLSPG
jgi:hypothetical protein